MDAAQQSKGSTENPEDSDDPDPAYCQNEKRKGRFLIEEIEEENPVLDDNMYYISDDNFKVGRCQSFNLKRYNFSVNTIGQNNVDIKFQESEFHNGLITGYILDYRSNKFINSENILKQNKSMLIHKYIDLYPHSSRADCIDCKNECMCRVIQANMQRVDNEQYFKTKAYIKAASSSGKFYDIEEAQEKLNTQELPADYTSKLKSQTSTKKECNIDNLSERISNQEISPKNVTDQTGNFNNMNTLKNCLDSNFNKINAENFLYSSPKIKILLNNIENAKKDRVKSFYHSPNIIREKNSKRILKKISVENSYRTKLFKEEFSERGFSADHKFEFKENKYDRVDKRNFETKIRKETQIKFSVQNENFQICESKNVTIENIISFSLFNSVAVSDRICHECALKLFHNFCSKEND